MCKRALAAELIVQHSPRRVRSMLIAQPECKRSGWRVLVQLHVLLQSAFIHWRPNCSVPRTVCPPPNPRTR